MSSGRQILLSQNFRSRKEVLDGANFIFSNLMSREMGEVDYGAAERGGGRPSSPRSRRTA